MQNAFSPSHATPQKSQQFQHFQKFNCNVSSETQNKLKLLVFVKKL
jgi:hypothetical protein